MWWFSCNPSTLEAEAGGLKFEAWVHQEKLCITQTHTHTHTHTHTCTHTHTQRERERQEERLRERY
jgi:hypothetical protein